MGNICSCLCPKRRKKDKTAYDVHQQTFEMQENIDSLNIDDNSPTFSKEIMSDETVEIVKSSTQNFVEKTKQYEQQKSSKLQQSKYVQSKMKSSDHDEEISLSNNTQDLGSAKDIRQSSPLLSKQQPTSSINQYKSLQHNLPTQTLNSNNQLKAQQPKPVEQIQKPIQAQKKPNPNILKPKAIRKKYNPDDYQFKNQEKSFRVKKIDSIKGQQYNIDNCKNSEYFIFDVTANVYIDDTESCKIYIAPCESTIFVRNCKNLVIIAATKQFRTYNCQNCSFSLLCKSQPVIQCSSSITFVPLQIHYYSDFHKQMINAKLDLWNNHWSEIHNFTKRQGESHYTLRRYLLQEEKINWEKGFAQGQIQPSEESEIPFIQGELPMQEEIKGRFIILFNKESSAEDLLILDLVSKFSILKGFKGKMAGFGKEDRVALLLGYCNQIQNQQKLRQHGQLFKEKEQIEKYQPQFFVHFGDEREK